MLRLSLLLTVSISVWLVEQTSGQAATTTPAMLCSPGKYMTSTNVCTLCPAGYFCTGYTRTATSCPAGTFISVTGSSECKACASGWYTTTLASKACTVCPAGYYCPKANSAPMACPAGTSTNNATGAIQCEPCWSGYVSTVAGSKFCSMCPDGFMCPNASKSIACRVGTASRYNMNSYRDVTKCMPCPIGTHASVAGSKTCNVCPNGSYCADPSLAPTLCPRGTSSMIDNNSYNYMYSSNNQRCQQCPDGFYAPNAGSATCLKCPEGFYCPDPTQALRCPVGTYRNNNPNPIKFPRQNLSMPIDASICIRCPQGYYQTGTGASTCMKCPKGFYCPEPTSAPRVCPLGTYSNSEYGQQTCYPCPDGTYANTTKSTICRLCPAGYYCPDPTTGPKLCPVGTYSNSTIGQVVCSPTNRDQNSVEILQHSDSYSSVNEPISRGYYPSINTLDSNRCARDYLQCGGAKWTGPTDCCTSNFTCQPLSPSYFACQPSYYNK